MVIWTIILFIIGLLMILKGGDYFVDASSWIAEISGVPKFIIGATIVSLATTLPEILVSAFAAGRGEIDMAIANAIGSVNANTGLVLSIGVLFMPVAVARKSFAPKALLLLIVVPLLLVLSISGELTVLKSIFLLVLFILFIIENLISSKGSTPIEVHLGPTKKQIIYNIVKFISGALGIVLGSQLLVDSGTIIAEKLGVPEDIIGLTAIAIGTSLPELVTTLTAISKKESALCVGNIVGANIIDTSLILPICAIVSGGSIPVSAQTLYLDIPICIVITAVSVVPSILSGKLRRWQGAMSVSIYMGYLIYRCFFI